MNSKEFINRGKFKNFDIDRLNIKRLQLKENTLKLNKTLYKIPKVDNNLLVADNGLNIGTKGDMYTKVMIDDLLTRGTYDNNPRPKYDDGTPAHTLSLNHGRTTSGVMTYDIAKGESPLITLRPIAVNSSIGELLWIYQDESNNLDLLKDKYNISWWDSWEVDDTRTIGAAYGETVRRHNSVEELLNGLKNDPDGRRHIISLWQTDDFKDPHGLKPCAYLTTFNIRHEWDGKDYLDMSLKQRSSDFLTAGAINQVQYLVFQHLIARDLNIEVGQFTWQYDNIQIYDRHIENAIEMINREPIDCSPKIVINEEKRSFYDISKDDVKVVGYPLQKIKKKNPQLKFDLGI